MTWLRLHQWPGPSVFQCFFEMKCVTSALSNESARLLFLAPTDESAPFAFVSLKSWPRPVLSRNFVLLALSRDCHLFFQLGLTCNLHFSNQRPLGKESSIASCRCTRPADCVGSLNPQVETERCVKRTRILLLMEDLEDALIFDFWFGLRSSLDISNTFCTIDFIFYRVIES